MTETTKLRVLDAALLAFWLAAGAFVLLSTAPHTPLTPSAAARARSVTFLPEGWAFFTRDPQEKKLYLYREHADGTYSDDNSVDLRGFGLFSFADRSWRVRSMESAQLTLKIPASSWLPCRDDVAKCVREKQPPVVRLDNPMNAKSLCGRFAAVLRRPTPWAWHSRGLNVTMPGEVARMEVSCGG